MSDTRMCPYCAEEVRAEAVKCKHCGSYLAARRAAQDWHRSASDCIVAGVCGGLAREFGVPTAVLRLAFVLMALFSGGVGILIYVVLWVVMPRDEWDDDADRLPREMRDR